jgi:hypothetical protein
MFSTCVTGMFGRRSVTDSGIPDLPTLTSSMAVENQAASIAVWSMPASWRHSWYASTISSSGPAVPALSEARAPHPEDGDLCP